MEIEEENIGPFDEPEIRYMGIEEGNIIPPNEPETRYMEIEEENNIPPAEPEIKYAGVKAVAFIIGNEAFEKLGTVGSLGNFMIYLTSVFHMKVLTATTLINIFNGITSIVPLLGAFLSDSYFGRYKTMAFASVSSLLGLIGLMLTAAISELHPPHCHNNTCVGPTAWQLAFLLAALSLLVVGAGGIRPCNLAFGVDQFNPMTESGKRGIRSFFNWYYFSFTFAVIVSATFITYAQTKNWAIGLAIPAFLMFISCALFFWGSRFYVKVKPKGSPLVTMAQVVVAATKKRRLKLPENRQINLYNYMPNHSNNSKLPYTDQFGDHGLKFLDKAAILTAQDQINSDGSASNPWQLCSIQQVEELKCIVRLIPIWVSGIVFHLALAQQQTYIVVQASHSDRRLGKSGFKVPAASYGVSSMLAIAMWIPIYHRVVVPFFRKLTGKEGGITLLQRIGFGIVLSILTMVISGLVEVQRRGLTQDPMRPTIDGSAISSMSGLWLIPQLALSGLCEAFSTIGQIELYYKEFPENMKSFSGAFFYFHMGLSNFLSGILISTVHKISMRARTGDWLPEDLNKGRLEYLYYMIASLEVLNFGYFLVCAKWYKYKGDARI